jgi:WD40 repeat protein
MVHVVPPVSSKKPFPENIKSSLPQPETPWQISPSLFSRIQSQTTNLAFRVCEIVSTDPEYDFILKHFEHQKPPGFGIKRIVCIHNPTHTQVFEGSLKNMEQEANNPYFLPQGRNEEPRADRAKVLYRWHQQVALFSPVMVTDSQARAEPCFNAKVLPLWHGSSESVCKSVCSSGFTSFGKHHYFDENASKGTNKSTDKGYFGSGIYFTNSAQYATMYSSEGHLLLSWVSMREPYPVVNDVPHPQKGSDMRKLEGKEHYQNYNAHFVPVASIRPEDPKCIEYYPCYKDQPPAWDEFVVFHSAQTLPRFWVELGVDFPKTLSLNPSEPKKEPGTGPIKIFQPPPPSAIISPLQEVCSKMGCLKIYNDHAVNSLNKLFIHPNGTLVSSSNGINIWNTSTAVCVRNYPISPDRPYPHFLLSNGLLLSQKITQPGEYKELAIWNLETGALIRTFGKFKNTSSLHSCILLAPDILAVGVGYEIYIWDLSKGQCLLTLEQRDSVSALVPLPQGKLICGSYWITKLWDLSTGECIRDWGGSTFILPLDSTIVASANINDKTIKFWDYSTGQCTKTLKGHQEWVSSLLRLQNGLLVSASNDHTIKLWDTLTGECLRTLEGHTSQVNSLALLPNETFASGSIDGTIRIWGIQPQTDSPISPPIHESPSAKQYAEQLQKIDEIKEAQKAKLERLKAKQEKPFAQNLAFSAQPVPTNATDIPGKAALVNASPQPAASLAPVLPKSSAKPALPAIAFGKEEWATYIGDVDDVPPLPPDIDKILQSPCPFWPDKKVGETHLLTLIPKKVNGKPLTLNYLSSLIPKHGKAMQYSWYWDEIKKEYGEKPLQNSYWALMTRDVIPGSRGKRYNDQARLLKELSQKAKVPYEVPHLLEAVTCIFMEYLRTEKDLYGENPLTYTRCQERVSSIPDLTLVVGHFEHNHLYSTIGVYYNNEDDEGEHNQFFGIGGLRKLSNNLSTPDDALAKQTLQKPLPPTPKTKTLPTEIAFTTSPVHSSSPSAATLDPVFSQAHPKTPPAAAFVKASPPREKEEELLLKEKKHWGSRLKGFFFPQRGGPQPK